MGELGDLAPLAIETLREGTAAVVKVSGELDISNIDILAGAIESIVGEHADRLALDLAGITFVDSSGIALLLQTSKRVGRLSLRNPSTVVQQIVEITGLTEILATES